MRTCASGGTTNGNYSRSCCSCQGACEDKWSDKVWNRCIRFCPPSGAAVAQHLSCFKGLHKGWFLLQYFMGRPIPRQLGMRLQAVVQYPAKQSPIFFEGVTSSGGMTSTQASYDMNAVVLKPLSNSLVLHASFEMNPNKFHCNQFNPQQSDWQYWMPQSPRHILGNDPLNKIVVQYAQLNYWSRLGCPNMDGQYFKIPVGWPPIVHYFSLTPLGTLKGYPFPHQWCHFHEYPM